MSRPAIGRARRRPPQVPEDERAFGPIPALAAAFLAMFASGPGQSFAVAVFLDEMLSGTGLSRAAFSTLYAAATAVSALAMVRLGRATDRFGVGAAWTVATIGLATACLVASVASGGGSVFVALVLLRMFGQGGFPLMGTLIVAGSFRRTLGQAMALASFGLTTASIVLPPLLVWLILSIGWRPAFRTLAIGMIALVLPGALLVRRRRMGRDVGHRWATPEGEESFPAALRRSVRLPRLEVPTPSAARLLVILSAPPLAVTAVVFHAVAMLGERGISLTGSAAALSAMGLASAAGIILAGAVSDRVSMRSMLAGMSAAVTAGTGTLLLPVDGVAYLSFVLLGLSVGALSVAGGVVWARTYGTAQIGRLQGTSFAVQIASAAAAPVIPALAIAWTGMYAPALVALGAYGALALALSARWRVPAGNKPTLP